MKVTLFGTGYVGLVTGACLAEVGHQVLCTDVDERKIANLQAGTIPIFEPGLAEMVAKNTASGQLDFTTDAARAVAYGDLQFIAVGTPPDQDGSADLQYVLQVATTVATHMRTPKVVVTKSTVPVGTADRVAATIAATLKKRGTELDFAVAFNPEFLKEGAAVEDFMKPDRIIVGTDCEHTKALMRELYAPFNRNHEKLMFMDLRSAELTKYAANCMLATKISFMNEMAGLAEALGADIEAVRKGIGSDPRIGYHFIYPGLGYGGSCFPKDIKALIHTADELQQNASLLKAVDAVNTRQKQVLFTKIRAYFDGQLRGKTIAIWGLAFKPDTDDMREAPSRTLMESLWQAGAAVQAFDPQAMDATRHLYGQRQDLRLYNAREEALDGADALAICTEWKYFRAPDFADIRARLNRPVLF
ncbi:MAG: UDP-glucose/GDP-mannose dehydrogenase family protein, partial [Cellvibrionales bacterium]|nr:UDP-glucose/GDP-mannose dehydrogenase family protein [Cellvibrionales bacterium]